MSAADGRRLTERDLEGDAEDLKARTLEGVRWLAYARGGVQLGTLVSTVIIARLIPPAEFGQAAIALALWYIGGSIGYEGFGASIVQRPTIDRRYLQAAAMLSLVGGTVVAGIVAGGLAPALAVLVDSELTGLLILVALSIVASSLATVPKALLRRRLDFRQLAINEVASAIVGTASALTLAFAGLDAEALVLAALISTIAGTALAYVVAPGALPRYHRDPLRELVGFATSVQTSSVLYLAQRHGAVAVVGSTLGSASAGLFQRAYSLAMEYQGKISSVMMTVAFPVYSRANDRSHALRLRSRIVQAHTTVLVPLLVLLAVQAYVFVPWLYGPSWAAAADPTAIMALAGLAGPLLSGTGPLVMALGKPQALLRYNAVTSVGIIASLLVGGMLGLIELCLIYLAFQLVNVAAAQYFLLGRSAGVPFRQLVDDSMPAFVSAAGMAVTAGAVSHLLSGTGVPAVLVLGAATAVGLATYGTLLRFLFPTPAGDLFLLLDRVLGLQRLGALLRLRTAPSKSA